MLMSLYRLAKYTLFVGLLPIILLVLTVIVIVIKAAVLPYLAYLFERYFTFYMVDPEYFVWDFNGD